MSPSVIYGILPSPPTRSAMWTAQLVGLDYTLHKVDMMKGENKTEAYLKINPAHTIPTFVDDDGFAVFESHAIVTYIADKYGKDDSLYPKDVKKRATVDSMLHFDNSSLWPNIHALVQAKMFGKAIDPEKEVALKDRLNTLNIFLGQRSYVAGDHVTVADLCVINSLSALKSFGSGDETKLASDYPNIARWQQQLKKEVKFYDDIVVKGSVDLVEYSKQFIEALKARAGK